MTAMLLPSLFSNLLRVQQFIAKTIAHEKLETERLQTIHIAITDISWYEEGRELFYHDQLFDVESSYVSGDTMIIKGLTDNRETEIHVAVNKLVCNTAFDLLLATIGENILDVTASQPSHFIFEAPLNIFRQNFNQQYCIEKIPMMFTLVQTPPPDNFPQQQC